jgi:DNA-binding NarL/FixJ family response regulator
MNTPDERRERRVGLALVGLFGLVASLAGVDVIADLREGTTVAHIAVEGAVAVVGLAGAIWTIARLRAAMREAQDLRAHGVELSAHLDASRAEAARWRAEAGDLIHGLSAAIDRQLERWGLTPAEKEIALLLLKGLSHKEVAEVRAVSESTVRQQARAIYRKSGLAGRAELAAFFLEDLLGPQGETRPLAATTA